MAYIVNMPKLGLEMEQGTVLEWKIDKGDEIEEGEVIAEVESEKSIADVEAREDGVLRRIYVEVDETVPPGTPIGIIAAADEDIGDLETEAESELEATRGEAPANDTNEETIEEAGTAETEPTASGSETAEAATSGQSDSTASTDDVKASPRAEKRAEELGVDLTTVEGTGPQDSITEDDVEAAASSSASESEGETAADVKASPRAEKRAEELGIDLTTVEGTGPQGAITADDIEAAAEAAEEEAIEPGGEAEAEPKARASERAERIVPDHPEQYRYDRTTAVLDADAATAVFDAKRAAENALDANASVTDILLVVLAETLREVPEVNATFEESTHHLHESQHVALVAPAPEREGLATRVVPDLDEQSFSDLVAARHEAGDEGKNPDEGPTATFTVANASDFDAAGKVVNPPAVAALEVDTVGQRAVPAENGVDLRSHVTCGMTYDTRAVDRSVIERFFDNLDANASDATDLVMKTYVE